MQDQPSDESSTSQETDPPEETSDTDAPSEDEDADAVEASSAEDDKAPEKKGSGALVGVLGFLVALGGGFAIGNAVRGGGEGADVGLEDQARYRVGLRGDEPQIGPDDALVTIIEFADYQCPYCAKAAGPLKEALASHGDDVRLIYKHFPLNGHKAATPAAKAAWAAHQQGKFWEVHQYLFEAKASLSGLDKELAELDVDVAKFQADMGSPEAAGVVDADMLAGAKVGVTGTPAFFVNGHRYVGLKSEEAWGQIIETELALATALADDGVARGDVYAKLMEDALTHRRASKGRVKPGELDPAANYRITADGRPALGPDDAPINIVIFSDFQCPYCAKLAPIAHELVERNDDVRVVFRNLPIPNHPRAREAAKASLAAWEQGKFWEMHDLLFERQRELNGADFGDYADELGLDTDRFEADAADAQFETMIEQDERLADHFKINSTPSAFVNGRPMRGAQPLAAFTEVIAEEREKVQALIDGGTPKAGVFDAVMQSAKAAAK